MKASHFFLSVYFFFSLFGELSLGFAENTASISIQANQSLRGKQAFLMYCHTCHTLKYAGYTTLNTPKTDLIKWFGKMPPDLSNIASARGQYGVKRFLNGFYPDQTRPFGSNNQQFLNVAMPNILGSVTDEQARQQLITDIDRYLSEVSDPNASFRKKIGVAILVFLIFFTVCFWFAHRY